MKPPDEKEIVLKIRLRHDVIENCEIEPAILTPYNKNMHVILYYICYMVVNRALWMARLNKNSFQACMERRVAR